MATDVVHLRAHQPHQDDPDLDKFSAILACEVLDLTGSRLLQKAGASLPDIPTASRCPALDLAYLVVMQSQS